MREPEVQFTRLQAAEGEGRRHRRTLPCFVLVLHFILDFCTMYSPCIFSPATATSCHTTPIFLLPPFYQNNMYVSIHKNCRFCSADIPYIFKVNFCNAMGVLSNHDAVHHHLETETQISAPGEGIINPMHYNICRSM